MTTISIHTVQSKQHLAPVASCGFRVARFPSSPLIIRVPFFLLFGFNKGTPKKRVKGYYWGTQVVRPRDRGLGSRLQDFAWVSGLASNAKLLYLEALLT